MELYIYGRALYNYKVDKNYPTIRNLTQRRVAAFALANTIVVVLVLALLSSAGIFVYSNVRIKLNDSKRLAIIKNISLALDSYYRDYSFYPQVLTVGNSLVGPKGQVYLTNIPNNPPRAGGSNCPATGFQYINLGSRYQLITCLDRGVGSLLPGGVVIKPGFPPLNVSSIAGLVGYWVFDERSSGQTFDYSGYNENATWYGSGPNHYGTSFNGTATAEFNGFNDYLTISSSALLNSKSLTIALWVKASEITGHNYILEKGSPSQFGISLEKGQHHGELKFSFDDNNTCNNKTRTFQGDTIVKADTWNFVAFSFDNATKVLKIYVNGQLDSSYVYNGCTPINDGDLYIGRKVSGSQGYEYGGLMDEISFFNRALTEAEILSLYNTTK